MFVKDKTSSSLKNSTPYTINKKISLWYLSKKEKQKSNCFNSVFAN